MVRASSSAGFNDAKINSSEKQVIMGAYSESSQQMVVDRTSELTQRTSAMASVLESVLKEKDFIRCRNAE